MPRLRLFLIFLAFTAILILSHDYLTENSPREILWDVQGIFSKRPLEIVLTFDYEDSESRKNLPVIFEGLEKRNAKATFFIVGKVAEASPESVREIARRNHSLALHTYAHDYPIFETEALEKLARVYNNSQGDWTNHLETKEALVEDIRKNHEAVERAAGVPLQQVIFRSPALTPNWAHSEAYFEALKQVGVTIDSSVYQDFANSAPYFVVNGIVEIPVVSSDSALRNINKGLKADKASKKRVPYVLVLYPQKLSQRDVEQLDALLSFLERKYKVTYLKIEEVLAFYSTQHRTIEAINPVVNKGEIKATPKDMTFVTKASIKL